MYLTLTNPTLWLLGISLGMLNACRYGYSDWGLAHLSEVHPESGLGKSALKISVLPIGAVAGVLTFRGGRPIVFSETVGLP